MCPLWRQWWWQTNHNRRWLRVTKCLVCCLCPRLANVIPGTSPSDKPFSIQLVENVENVGTSLSLKPSADTGAATRYAIPAPARTIASNFLSRKVLSCSLSRWMYRWLVIARHVSHVLWGLSPYRYRLFLVESAWRWSDTCGKDSPVSMVRPMKVQMTPEGGGADTASHSTCTNSPTTPIWQQN